METRGSDWQRATRMVPRRLRSGPSNPCRCSRATWFRCSIGPRDGNHGCDLTDLELSITSAADGRVWSLTGDVSSDVLAANPHADRFGNKDVWHFYTEVVQRGDANPLIPAGSLIARWMAAPGADEKQKLAVDVQTLLTSPPPADPKHPDAALYRQLVSLGGPLFAGARTRTRPSGASAAPAAGQGEWGLDPALFGRHPNGSAVDAASLCVQAPNTVEIRLPADLAADCDLVTTAILEPQAGAEGSVQASVATARSDSLTDLRADVPVLTAEGSAARKRFEKACDDFRGWFPAALCYTQIVPVDEVVTLTLFHREDEPLCRLMLDERQKAELDRLWDELHFVSHDALTLVDAFAQLMEYATQDSDPKVFEPLRKPIHDRAAAFRQELLDAEPRQVEALLEFAARAYRAAADTRRERRAARAVSQAAGAGASARRGVAVHARPGVRLAGVSVPARKGRPRCAARAGVRLGAGQPAELFPLVVDARRGAARSRRGRPACASPTCWRRRRGGCSRDARVRRLATEFACQWLHIYDFDTLDEKSEQHFPTFAGAARRHVRGGDSLLHRPVPARRLGARASSTPTTRSSTKRWRSTTAFPA